MSSVSNNLLRGSLELLILKALSLEPLHGVGIAQRLVMRESITLVSIVVAGVVLSFVANRVIQANCIALQQTIWRQ